MMTREEAKNFIALYDDTYSCIQVANMTGYSIPECDEMYDEILRDGELWTRKKAMKRMNRQGGVYRINPVTFESDYFDELSQLKELGINVSNIFYACRNKASLCSGYLWRYGVDVNPEDIEGSLKQASPELFIPVYQYDPKTDLHTSFETLQIAHASGFNKKCVMEVINGKKKTYKGCKWFRSIEELEAFRDGRAIHKTN